MKPVKFLHTADWQLGMTRHFLSEGAQERFTQARFDAIRRIGQFATDAHCLFVVVCGDVFESNQVDRKTVYRALEALKEISVPVYLLPGNHDPLNDVSVYRSRAFVQAKPAHVHVVENCTPIPLEGGAEIIGAPWVSKRAPHDLVTAALSSLQPSKGAARICVGHGIVDTLSPDRDNPATISLTSVERALSEGRIHYLALGDRHSVTNVGSTDRVWYAGSPEPTDYDEEKSGFALTVEVDENSITAKEIPTGSWAFVDWQEVHLNSPEDLESFRHRFEVLPNKEKTIIRMRFVGSVSLQLLSELEEFLSRAGELLGAVEVRLDGLISVPDDCDFADLGLSGFASCALERLRSTAKDSGGPSGAARDALALLIRLAGEVK